MTTNEKTESQADAAARHPAGAYPRDPEMEKLARDRIELRKKGKPWLEILRELPTPKKD